VSYRVNCSTLYSALGGLEGSLRGYALRTAHLELITPCAVVGRHRRVMLLLHVFRRIVCSVVVVS
jgi:hypothetical protein